MLWFEIKWQSRNIPVVPIIEPLLCCVKKPLNYTSEFTINPCKRSLVQLSVIGAVLAEGRLLKLVLSSKTLILMIIETHSIWPSIKRHITIISLAKVGSKPPLTKVLLVKLALLLRLPTSCLAASSFLGLASWFGSFQLFTQNCGSCQVFYSSKFGSIFYW